MEKKTDSYRSFILHDNNKSHPQTLEIISKSDGEVYIGIHPDGEDSPVECQSVLVPKDELIAFLKESIAGL